MPFQVAEQIQPLCRELQIPRFPAAASLSLSTTSRIMKSTIKLMMMMLLLLLAGWPLVLTRLLLIIISFVEWEGP